MTEALEDHIGTYISMQGSDHTPSNFGIQINTEKTKLLISGDNIGPDIIVRGHKLETVNQ